jgi:peptidoglycan/xylan/chitin deacetylase (PgdA/CDA1 family)
MARTSALVRRTVKVASAAADRLRPPVEGVVILLYHRVGGGSSLEIDLDAARFEEQIAAVAASRRAVPLGAALDRLNAPSRPAEGPAVVVTFDDGTADFVEVALPILVRHAVPATLYLATGFVEDGRAFPSEGRPVSWSALRDACATGLIDIGSHTHTHPLLDRIPPAEAADELDRSIELIGSRLGRPAYDFAYPKAVAGSPEVIRLVRDRFRSAALAGTRVNPYRTTTAHRTPPAAKNLAGKYSAARNVDGTDVYRLARSPIQVSDGMEFFERKLAGGMALEDSFRRVLNRVRYAKAST